MYKLFAPLLFIIVACNNDSKKTEELPKSDVVREKIVVKNSRFPKYSSVIQMLNESYDYTESKNTLKLISEDPLHIQVSKEFVEGDTEEIINEQVKRDIVYISLQAFAQTDVTSITITSIPIMLGGDFKFERYLDKNKLTKTIKKENADIVLEKYLSTKDYTTLFQNVEKQIYVPNENFDRLKGSELESVFFDLTK